MAQPGRSSARPKAMMGEGLEDCNCIRMRAPWTRPLQENGEQDIADDRGAFYGGFEFRSLKRGSAL